MTSEAAKKELGLPRDQAALYVSLSRDRPGLVTLLGSGSWFAAARHPETGKVVYDFDVVQPITKLEFQRFRREYNKLLKVGSLIERTRAEYEAYLEHQLKVDAEEYEKRKRETSDKAEAVKPESKKPSRKATGAK